MASRKVEFHQEAALELEAGFDWYFSRSEQAASKFVDEVTSAINAISEAPQRWPATCSGIRKFPLKRFPFVVFYRELSSTIQVLAVAHGHRRPGYWKERASGE